MEILFSFKTTGNPNVSYIFEIKYLNLPQDAPKSDKYKWFYFSNNELTTLQFKARDDQTRNFQCGLFLDMENMKISKNEMVENIVKCDDQDNSYINNLISV